MPGPASKNFDLADVVRVQVTQTIDARALINASSEQGRLLPQALAEDFARYREVVRVELTLAPRRLHVPMHPEEAQDAQVLLVSVVSSVRPPVQFLLDPSILAQVHPQGPPYGFVAAACAHELVRLYPGGIDGR